MRTLVNMNPTSDFARMNDMLDRMFAAPTCRREQGMSMPMDVYEKDGVIVVRAAVPGIAPQDLDINVEKDVLTIRAETKPVEEMDEAKVYLREVAQGSFSRSVRLPDDLKLDEIKATFEHGFVTVRLPRHIEQPKSVKIEVQTED